MPAFSTPNSPAIRRLACRLALVLLAAADSACADPASLSGLYRTQVTPRLELPEAEAARYGALALGTRVYDLGWQQALRLWGNGGLGTIRLQMHATDPDRLEPRLGIVRSKGCIRIPGTLNRLLDQHGVLDAACLALQADGMPLWVLPPHQQPEADAGRYAVVIDSKAMCRPPWSPLPGTGRARH